MRQTGIILSKTGSIAEVGVLKNPVCLGCHGCFSLTGQTNMPTLRVNNDLDAPVGARVEFEIPPRQVLGGALMVFIFPLIMLVLGYWIAMKLVHTSNNASQSVGIVGAAIGLVIGYIVLKRIDRLWAKRHPVDAVLVNYTMPSPDDELPANCPLSK